MTRALLLLLLVGGCSEQEHKKPPKQEQPMRRVYEPPTGTVVRALPPFAIQKDGVGPYKLGERLEKILEELPSGPHIALFDIPGVVHKSLIRAEDDTVLIGGEPTSGVEATSAVSFVAVIGTDVARTESGAHVGATREELAKALGVANDDPDRARDPRVIVPAGWRNLRVLTDADRVTAIAVVVNPGPTPPASVACTRPASSGKAIGACLDKGELIDVEGDDLGVRVPEAERPFATAHVTGLVFAAPLRNPTDGRDELVAIARTDDAQLRTWSLHVYKLDGQRRVKGEVVPFYQLSSSNARWIGAELRDVDLYLELASRPDVIEVGGLLTTRPSGKIRDVVVISQVPVARRHGKAPEVDAGVDTVDAGGRAKP